jgi:hypothetical protein
MGARRLMVSMVVGWAAVALPAAPAMATVTTTSITAPADGTQLFQNVLTDPNQMITVSGTSDGTSGVDSVDIWCYEVNSHLRGYTAGITVGANGDFTAQVPESDFPANTCHLIAVPHGTPPSSISSYSGPRVSFSQFNVSMIASGPNAGKSYDLLLADMTMTAQTYINSFDSCGPATTLPKANDPTVTVSGYMFSCAGNFYNSAHDLGAGNDMTRSEIQVDGQNVYGAASANALFGSATSAGFAGFPGATVTLGSFDPATGDAQLTDSEPLVTCLPADAYNPSSNDCTSFGAAGVTISRLNQLTSGARVTTQVDTISSTDGAAHTVDLLYETDLGSTAGWELPGQSSFTQHSTGDTAGGPGSGPGTIYVINNPGSSPSFNNVIGDMTFATPYTSIRFDNTLSSSQSSALIDYQRTVPAGGCTTIAWSYGTGESQSEVSGYAATAAGSMAAPSVAITAPASGSRVHATSVQVTGTVNAASGIDCVSVNGVGATVSGGTWSATVPLSAGQNTLAVTASSLAGGTTTTSERVTLDKSAPTVSIVAPANGAVFALHQVVDASYACADADGASDIARCAGPVGSGRAIDTSTPGSHTFAVAAGDQAGNTGAANSTYIVVAPPTVSTSGHPSERHRGSTVLVDPGISVSCPVGTLVCTVSLAATTTAPASAARVKRRVKTFAIGRASFTILPGKTTSLTFKLTDTGARLLTKLGVLRVKLALSGRTGTIAEATAEKTITLRKPQAARHRRRTRR